MGACGYVGTRGGYVCLVHQSVCDGLALIRDVNEHRETTGYTIIMKTRYFGYALGVGYCTKVGRSATEGSAGTGLGGIKFDARAYDRFPAASATRMIGACAA